MLIRHTQHLLERRNCVVLPGFGALICATDSARFDQRNSAMLLPPRRRMTFNSSIVADDGVLVASFTRSLGISFEEAKEKVSEEISALIQSIMLDGSATFGELGYFHTTLNGNVAFSPNESSCVNCLFASLIPVDIDRLSAINAKMAVISSNVKPSVAKPDVLSIESTMDVEESIASDKQTPSITKWAKLRNRAAGIAASVAIIATLTLFLLNPIRMANEPQKASFAPIPTESIVESTEPIQKERPIRRLTIGLPEENGYVAIEEKEIEARQRLRLENSQNISSDDRFCVIVASFPTISQAQSFIAEKGGNLAILEKDGKCRVYAATAPTFEMATALRDKCGIDDAWVCRR